MIALQICNAVEVSIQTVIESSVSTNCKLLTETALCLAVEYSAVVFVAG